MSGSKLKHISLEIPKSAGVYLFINNKQEVIYIGKAKDLRSRISSYFQKTSQLTPAEENMLNEISHLDYLVVDSEEEALTLESILVRRLMPKYNVDLKDDKSKVYIQITKEDFPGIYVVRERVREKTNLAKSFFFGPYSNAKFAKEVLKTVNRIFLQREAFFSYQRKSPKDYQLGLNLEKYQVAVSKKEYQATIQKIKSFLKKDYKRLIVILKKEMQLLSGKKEFEKAAKVRNQIFALEDIQKQAELIKKQGLFKKELDVIKALSKLKEVLDLKKLPQRIEAYDISNIQGQFAVGSMIVFTNGEPDTDQYRKFKIRTVMGANDVAMMKEVLIRRFKNRWPKPDLILVDGGKPQLNVAVKVLEILNKKIPIAALAKREEELFLPDKKTSIKLSKNSSALYLIQRLRDEAHRFAISYYRSRHIKEMKK